MRTDPVPVMRADAGPKFGEGAPTLWTYLAGLTRGRFLLWMYFFWWAVVVVRYFDPSPRLWLTSAGVSVVIGIALYISTSRAGSTRVRLETWSVIRLFLTPFCVSSFSALVKNRGFIVVFSTHWQDAAIFASTAGVFGLVVLAARRMAGHSGSAA